MRPNVGPNVSGVTGMICRTAVAAVLAALVLGACGGAEHAKDSGLVFTPGEPIPVNQSEVRVGVSYQFTLLTHCGITETWFAGRGWKAVPPLSDGQGNPPPGWDNPTQTGTMMLESADRAVFRDTAGHTVVFRPGPPTSRGCD